jgi:hypothetical protein
MADKLDKILNQLGIGMDARLAELVRDAYRIIMEGMDEDHDDILDVIAFGEASEDLIIHAEWSYLLGVADAFDLTISQVIEEAQCPKPK